MVQCNMMDCIIRNQAHSRRTGRSGLKEVWRFKVFFGALELNHTVV